MSVAATAAQVEDIDIFGVPDVVEAKATLSETTRANVSSERPRMLEMQRIGTCLCALWVLTQVDGSYVKRNYCISYLWRLKTVETRWLGTDVYRAPTF